MSLLAFVRDVNAISALGHKRTFAVQNEMSALPPIADMCSATRYVCFVPIADILRWGSDVCLPLRADIRGHEKSVECCRHLTRGSTYRLYSHRPWSRRRQTVPHKTRPVIERLGNVTDHTCQAPSSLRRRAAVLRTCTAFRVRVSFCNIGDGCQKMGSC